ncbi:MAG: TonB-dependent receptor [Bacteroides sp.]
MKKIHILSALFLGLGASAFAQTTPNDTTMNRTVVVEREYNPIIQGASKVNVLPEVEEPSMSQKEVEYELNSVPAQAVPISLVKPFVAKEYEARTWPGYLRLGAGNLGNIDARGHYTFQFNERDQLSLDVSSWGMNGKLKYADDVKWKTRYYRTEGSMLYRHQFDQLDLSVFANMGVHNFNLRNEFVSANTRLLELKDYRAPKQNFTYGNVGFGLKSRDEFATLLYDISSQFGVYGRQYDPVEADLKETLLQTQAKVWTRLDDENKLGLDLNMHNRFVNSDSIKNSTTLDFNPYYGFESDNWKLRLGAHIDLGFGFGKSFLVSPDLDIQYIFSDNYILYAQAKGGRIHSNFKRFQNTSPYTFISGKNRDTYEQINASLGFKASPIPGLWLNLYGGYQMLKDDLYISAVGESSLLSHYSNEDTKNFYGGASLFYDYKNRVGVNLAAIGRKWKTDGFNNNALLFKPKMEFEAGFYLKPIEPLKLGVNYTLVSREEPDNWVGKLAVDNISKLSAHASYQILKPLSVYIVADNLMNKKYQYYYAYPVEGLNFIAGLSFQF